ncbi:hypothetical protein [Stieleria varia]|uniref:Uncharacterized protein n=1 Tax=Stieleria varia TaxID=2528005 RepID=A0A5C6APW2_9BACT|nr:hypothetical protein [Stieleria varia]TWU01012.1 hypothetical protein Pla52n_43830 [Stieleria varia]
MNIALPNLAWWTHQTLCIVAVAILLWLGGCRFGASDGDSQLPKMHSADEVQYFPTGPEFKLPREAVALQKAREEEKRLRTSGKQTTTVDNLHDTHNERPHADE